MHFKKLINVSFNIKSSSIFNQENGQPISGQDIYSKFITIRHITFCEAQDRSNSISLTNYKW